MKRQVIFTVVVILWVASVTALYYVYHKPLNIELAATLLLISLRCATAAAVCLAAGGLGAVFLPFLPFSRVVNAVVHFACGMMVLAPVYYLLGSVLGTGVWLAWGVLALLLAGFHRGVIAWLRQLSGVGGLVQGRSILARVAGLVTAGIAGMGLLIALAPPVKFDSLVYHLALPEWYTAAGRMLPVPGSWFWGMPQSGEMLYTWAIALLDERSAALLGWAWACAAVAGVFGWMFERAGRRAAWVAVASLLAGTTLASSLGVAYVDWLAVLFGFAGTVTLLEWERSGGRRLLILSGLFCGAAVGVKWSAGVLLVACLVSLLAIALEQRMAWRVWFGSSVLFGVAAALVISPWLIKNFLASGNPLYPFLQSADEVSRFRAGFYRLEAWGSWREVLTLPLDASLTGVEGTPGYSATIGPLLVGLLPFGLFSAISGKIRSRRDFWLCALFVFSGLVIWGVASRFAGLLVQSRLYFVLFPAWAFLAGWGFQTIDRVRVGEVRLGRVIAGLVLLVYVFTGMQVGMQFLKSGSLQTLAGVQSEDRFLEDNLGWYAPAMRAVTELPEGSSVLMLWEPRRLYCLPTCTPDEILDRWLVDRLKFGDGESILAAWRAEGYTHLLYHRLGSDFVRSSDMRYDPADWEVLDRLLEGLAEESNFGDAYSLYILAP